ncbi:MAG: hypothetical protein UY42_C0030G0006 [Parcubacteria group bacterium GW2011_GWA2_49_16]|nr:MAG: hypothetical protein UY42_C0030G0006 [Parcubacteria group bacterium GW2011_GWA2_49_16]
MLTFTQLLPILAAAIAGYAVAALWYSPALFMKPWMRGVHKTEANLLANKKEMSRIMVYSFFVSFATAFGLSTFLALLDIHTVIESLQIAILIAFAFVITAKFSDMLYISREPHWSRVPQQLFLIEAGYAVASLSAMAVVLALLN